MFENFFREKMAVGENRDQRAQGLGGELAGGTWGGQEADEVMQARSGAGEAASSVSIRSSVSAGTRCRSSVISRSARGRSWKAKLSRRCMSGQLFEELDGIARVRIKPG